MPGIAEPGEDPQVFYRAMDFLLDAGEEVQRSRTGVSHTNSGVRRADRVARQGSASSPSAQNDTMPVSAKR